MPSSYSIYTQEPVTPNPPPSRRRIPRWLVRSAGAALLLVLFLGLGRLWLVHRHNVQRQQLLAMLRQERSPAKVREAIRSGQITRDDAREVFAARRYAQLDAYFRLPPGPQRTQYLDKLIGQLRARRAQFVSAPRPRPAAADRPDANQAPTNRAARMESIPPDRRAEFQQFRLDMQRRVSQLGIAPLTFRRG